jgi:Homoserine trans-succinylase
LQKAKKVGCICVWLVNGREIYITGHSEYSPGTLDFEYHRDLEKGLNPRVPVHYYRDDDPSKEVIVRWRSHANLLFSNWLNYFVYQETPYDIRNIK